MTKNTEIQASDFLKELKHIQEIGKKFVPGFQYDPDSLRVYTSLLLYFSADERFEELAPNYKLNKGLLIRGNIGVGKSFCMKIFRQYLQHIKYNENFIFHLTTDVVQEYLINGEESLLKHGIKSFRKGSNGFINLNMPLTRCYDDLGVENSKLSHFGNDRNLMAEILIKRYDLFISTKLKTIVTTNLSPDEIEFCYGNRVRSRMREMFNDIIYEGTDKRK